MIGSRPAIHLAPGDIIYRRDSDPARGLGRRHVRTVTIRPDGCVVLTLNDDTTETFQPFDCVRCHIPFGSKP